MNNENINNNTSSPGFATVSKIGQLAIFNYTPDNKNKDHKTSQEQSKKKIHFHFLEDNSGSMSRLTQESANIFVHGLIGKIPGCSTKGSLVTFDEEAQVLARNFDNPSIMQSIKFPSQARTNITAGVKTALDLILDTHKEEMAQLKKKKIIFIREQ